jgi:hypothetical protein
VATDIKHPNLRDRRVAASDSRRHIRRRRDVQVIILHSTDGPWFLPDTPNPYPADPGTDAQVRSRHLIDRVRAHFVVTNDGTVFYTHDVEFLSGSAGGQAGIDIEFAGRFSLNRLRPEAVRSGRALIGALKSVIPAIGYIHPHGQIQRELMSGRACGGTTGVRCGKLNSCPGPDVWVNIGEWAARRWGLVTDTPLPSYQNNGITAAQRDSQFDQHIP